MTIDESLVIEYALDLLGRNEKDFVERFAEIFDLGANKAEALFAKIDSPESGDWTSSMLPSVDILKFEGGPRVTDTTCGLVSVKPDTVFPRHKHRGEKRVPVSQGMASEKTANCCNPATC